jgi:choline-sulfatase
MTASKRPNILFILTDDQGCWALGAAGNREIHTPHLDRLAAAGIHFENFFCASPVCSPARASILTGRMPSQHGIHDWIRRGNLSAEDSPAVFAGDDAVIRYLEGQPGYTDFLAAAGYHCGLSGKWHLGDSKTPQNGFSYWRLMPYGGFSYFNAPILMDGKIELDPRYLSDVITEHALTFLDQHHGSDQPFYLGVHYTAPHSPWDAHEHPADLRALYDGCPFESVPDLPAHPWQINSAPRGTGEKRRELLTGYYAAISGLDRGVGRLLDWLDAHGLTENTLVIFTSDNGMNMGHHGIWGKGNGTFPLNMYDTSVKVPVLFSMPGSLPQNIKNQDLLSHYDILPTLLDYLGLENPLADVLPGRSFAALLDGRPLLEGDSPDRRGEIVVHTGPVVFDEYGPVRMIRTREWKYVHRYPYGPHELYDLVNDPAEDTNRINDPAAAAHVAEMKARLDEWFLRYSDPRVDGAKEAVTGKGQIDLAGILGEGRPAFTSGDWWYIDADGNRKYK